MSQIYRLSKEFIFPDNIKPNTQGCENYCSLRRWELVDGIPYEGYWECAFDKCPFEQNDDWECTSRHTNSTTIPKPLPSNPFSVDCPSSTSPEEMLDTLMEDEEFKEQMATLCSLMMSKKPKTDNSHIQFISMVKSKPEDNQMVLVKLVDNINSYAICIYHEAISDATNYAPSYFSEVSHTPIWYNETDISCWAPVEELNKIQIQD